MSNLLRGKLPLSPTFARQLTLTSYGGPSFACARRRGLPSVAASEASVWRRMVPVRGYDKGSSAENLEFVGIAAYS